MEIKDIKEQIEFCEYIINTTNDNNKKIEYQQLLNKLIENHKEEFEKKELELLKYTVNELKFIGIEEGSEVIDIENNYCEITLNFENQIDFRVSYNGSITDVDINEWGDYRVSEDIQYNKFSIVEDYVDFYILLDKED